MGLSFFWTNAVIVSTGRSDQKARLNCSSISFPFYVIFQPLLHYPSVYIYRLTISTLGNKTKYFEFLTLNNGEFNYPVIFLNLPQKLRKNENTWPWLIMNDN